MLTPRLNRRSLTRKTAFLTTLAALCLILPLAALRAPAQNMSGKFYGTVYDASGGVVQNATVIVSNAQAGTKDMTTTNQFGIFDFATLPAGEYLLEVLKPGFARFSLPNVTLEAGRSQQQNVTLKMGEVSERIDVVAKSTAKVMTPEAPAGQIHVGGDVQYSKLVKMVRPEYPVNAKAAGIEGAVLLEAVIAKDGSLLSLRVMNSQIDPDLAKAAVEAVSQWRYQPTLLNGVPVEVITSIDVNFTLSKDKE